MSFNDYVNQGVAFFQKNEFRQALENFKAALNLDPDNKDIKGVIGDIERQLLAKQMASQAAASEAHKRAEVLGITDVEQAIADFTEALKSNPNDTSTKSDLASAYYIRGLTFTSKEDYANAIADYSNAIKHNPNYPFAFNKRAQSYLENGDFDKAIADFEELIRLEPNQQGIKNLLANAYLKRGISFDEKGDYTHAIPDFEMVLKYKPNDNTASELLAMARVTMAKG